MLRAERQAAVEAEWTPVLLRRRMAGRRLPGAYVHLSCLFSRYYVIVVIFTILLSAYS